MRKLAIVALLALLIIVAGCAKKALVEEPTLTETTEDTQLDTGDVDELAEDLSADDIEADLADLDPDELKDFDF